MDIYAEITNRIIAEMEQGIIPWKKPWVGNNSAVSHITGKPYSLLNQMLLGEPGEYLTYRQCLQEGGHIRKGEKGKMIVFWKWVEKIDEETGEKIEHPFLRYYNVFHISQCEDIKSRYSERTGVPIEVDVGAEGIISLYLQNSGVKIYHKPSGCAYYCYSDDTIVLPEIDNFCDTAEYYVSVFHELAHSTGHSSRLNRIMRTAAFGSEEYSKEELTAEIAAAALAHYAGLETRESFRNNVAYVQNWLQVLNNDKHFIVSASSKAEKAVKMILGQGIPI